MKLIICTQLPELLVKINLGLNLGLSFHHTALSCVICTGASNLRHQRVSTTRIAATADGIGQERSPETTGGIGNQKQER